MRGRWQSNEVSGLRRPVAAVGVLAALALACLGGGVAAGPESAASANTWTHTAVAGFSTSSGDGFWLVHADGSVETHGSARFLGDASALALNQPAVGGAATADGDGYWVATRDGGVFAFGEAPFLGSMASARLAAPVVSLISTPTGRGYWLLASDGGVFSFGDAAFHGSTGGLALNLPVVGMIASRSGDGYRLVARDGGIFAFGRAPYLGSLPAIGGQRSDLVGSAVTPSGDGYWVVAEDGRTFAFGDARQLDEVRARSCDPVSAVVSNPKAQGLRLVLRSGRTVPVGDAPPGGNEPTGGPACSLQLPLRRSSDGAFPLRVMVLGDSMAISFQAGMGAALLADGVGEVIGRGRHIYGLTSAWPISAPCDIVCHSIPHYWPGMLDDEIATYDPDVVVLTVGLWDHAAARMVDTTTLVPRTHAWRAWYSEIQDDAIARLTRRGAVVYWIPYVQCGGDADAGKQGANIDAWAAASRHPHSVSFLDLNAAVCTDGSFVPLELTDGTPVTLIDPLLHYTDDGGRWLGQWLADRLSTSR